MRKLGRVISIFILCLFIMETSLALQIKPIRDNQTVFAKVSAKELTRIFVLDDRIQSVRGVEGTYELIKDEHLGAIFIKAEPSLHKAFAIFLTTDSGHTYNMLLTPMEIPSEEIELKPLSPAKKLAKRWETNSPYLETLVRLMSDMANQVKPEGYAVIDFSNATLNKYSPGFTLQQVALYNGSYLQGEVWQLKNISGHTLYLRPATFFKRNVRAVSIEHETVQAGSETRLYQVAGHD